MLLTEVGPQVYSSVTQLFSSAPDLIIDFKKFLPDDNWPVNKSKNFGMLGEAVNDTSVKRGRPPGQAPAEPPAKRKAPAQGPAPPALMDTVAASKETVRRRQAGARKAAPPPGRYAESPVEPYTPTDGGRRRTALRRLRQRPSRARPDHRQPLARVQKRPLVRPVRLQRPGLWPAPALPCHQAGPAAAAAALAAAHGRYGRGGGLF